MSIFGIQVIYAEAIASQTLISKGDLLVLNSNGFGMKYLLENDSIPVGTQVTTTLVSQPKNGVAYLIGGFLLYVPQPEYRGYDRLDYQVTDDAGNISIATVVFIVWCNGCTQVTRDTLTISWNPNPDKVDGYHVYYGRSENTIELLSSTVLNEATYSVANDLGMSIGEHVCFRIRAYNTVGFSKLSSAACTKI